MKYSQHDRVIYNGKKGKILTGWKSINGKTKYRVDMDGGLSIETTEDKLSADESDPWGLEEVNSKRSLDVEKKCPRCGCEWKVTKFGNNEWKDCLYCKKTKEDILKNYKEKGVEKEPYSYGFTYDPFLD
jgi:hypothetical protein